MSVTARRLCLLDPAATQRLGEALGRTAQAGDVLLLHGGLGAGKTTLTQGIARGLGISERVASPTFTLLNEYHEGRVPLFHFDLYRLSPEDLIASGLTDYWEGQEGLSVLEWAERLGPLVMPERLEIALLPEEDGRTAMLEARGDRPAAWLEAAHAAL